VVQAQEFLSNNYAKKPTPTPLWALHSNCTHQSYNAITLCLGQSNYRYGKKSILKASFLHITWIYMSLDKTTKTSSLHSFWMLCSARRKPAISQKQNLLLIHMFTKIPTMLGQWQPKYGKRLVVIMMCLYNMVTSYISVLHKEMNCDH